MTGKNSTLKWTDRSSFWVWLVIVYFVFHTLYRTFLGPGLGPEESETYFFADHLQMGYGPQPPLYFWIQWGFFQVFGHSLFAIALVKNLLFSFIFLLTFFLFRRSYPIKTAGLAMLSLLLLPVIIWEGHKSLTHSILVTLLTILAVFCFVELAANRKLWKYAGFGLVLGLGVVSKFNFVFFPVAMLLAALSIPKYRKAVLDIRMLASFAVLTLVLVFPVQWMLENQDILLQDTYKFGNPAGKTPLELARIGSLSLLDASFSFLAVLLFLAAGYYPWRRKIKTDVSAQQRDFQMLLLRSMVIAVALVAISIILSGTSKIKDTWMLPSLILGAPLILVWIIPVFKGWGLRIYLAFVGLLVFATIVILPIKFFWGEPNRMPVQGRPYLEIAKQIDPFITDDTLVISYDLYLLANLELVRKDWPTRLVWNIPLNETRRLIWLAKPPGTESLVQVPITLIAPYPYRPDQNYTRMMYIFDPEGSEK